MDEHDPDYVVELFQSAPMSTARRMASVVVGTLLLATAIWMGETVRTNGGDSSGAQYRVDDRARGLVYLADPTGDVRVLGVRSGISEITRLHHPQRHDIRSMTLDLSGRWLTVDTHEASYVYDTRNFALRERKVLIAERANTASTPN